MMSATPTLGELSLEDAAQSAAGNWQQFSDFAWIRSDDVADPEQWGLFYISSRDSGLIAESNEAVINKALQPFTDGQDPDVVAEHHGHWAVGYVDGYSIRVYRDGKITEAFAAYHKLQTRLLDYPVLSSDDLSRREHEAACENIRQVDYSLRSEYALPADWAEQVYGWLWDHDQSALDSSDDLGAYPARAAIEKALVGLGFRKLADDEEPTHVGTT